jgi:selenocysteine-specific elongation factor
LDSGVEIESFAFSRNCNAQYTEQLLKRLEEDNVPFYRLKLTNKTQPVLLHANFYQNFCNAVVDCLKNYHKTNSNQLGMSEPALSKSVSFKNSHLLFHGILEKLITDNKINRTGTLLHLPNHEVQLSLEEKTFMDKIRPVLLDAGFIPPRTRELTEITGMQLRNLERTLAQARKAGSLVQVAPNRHYLPETMMQLAEFTETLAQQSDVGFSVIQFRDEISIGRNLCIEILEYFDKVGFTRRDGNSRFVRTPKENLFGNTEE